ncbi:MAG: nicotinate-nucleotide--dimethylbenzimidazole phosphoribosyltransferase [Actinobacteria bacterium]|nr:nicotinate-nucleotide--dimethylbenzimidazole phosphoribosyltransferase [Actinomycetota bacterium]
MENIGKLKSITAGIKIPEKKYYDLAQEKLDNLTKPLGSLGRLEELARQIVGITGNLKPVLDKKYIFTMAADHGVVDEGISAYPREVTPQMVYNFLNGGAGINVLSKHIGAEVVVVDMGVAVDLESNPSLIIKKVGYGTKNMAKRPAMTMEEAVSSIISGICIAEEYVKKGAKIIGTGDMGIGNTTPSSAIISVAAGVDPSMVTGYGTGIDDKGLANKIEVIRKAINLNKPDPNDGLDILSKVGGFEIGGIAGLIIGAAYMKIPVVIDGFISGAGAIIAEKICPASKEYMIASHQSVERGHRIMMEKLGLKPLFNLDMRLGEGTGAALGIGLAEASVKIFNEMATFKEAGVSEKSS